MNIRNRLRVDQKFLRGRLVVLIARLLIGLLFVVSGVDGLYFLSTGGHLIEPPTSAAADAFDNALVATDFMWPLIKICNLIGGASLLLNIRPAAGLAVILPAVTVISLYHLVLNPAGIPIVPVMDALVGVLLYAYRDQYEPLLRRPSRHAA